jgi:hypothetical protein
MPQVSPPYEVKSPQADPGPQGSALSRVYTARPASFYLFNMVSTLVARGGALFSFIPAGIIHRLLSTIAVEMGRQDKYVEDALPRAIRNSVYEAFATPPAFNPRLPASYAASPAGIFRRLGGVAIVDEVIPADTILATVDGRTAVTVEDAVCLAGSSSVTVTVRSEIVGRAGEIAAGELSQILTPLPGPYSFTNATALDGGREEETDESVRARFEQYVISIGTATPDSVLAAARGATVVSGGVTYSVRDAALVQPWRVPGLNLPPGLFYVVVEAGGGTAPGDLVAAVQSAIMPKTAAGNQGVAISCAAMAVAPTVSYTYAPGYDPVAIEAAITSAWLDWMSASLVEDGTGRGDVATDGLAASLALAHEGVVWNGDGSPRLTLNLSAITPPVGARAVAGNLTFTRSVA